MGSGAAFGMVIRVGTEDDVFSSGQWPTDGFMSFAAHQNGLAPGNGFEAFEVGGKMPGQAIVLTDHAVGRCCDNEGYFHESAIKSNRLAPPAFSWERGHLGRHFCGQDAHAPKGE